MKSWKHYLNYYIGYENSDKKSSIYIFSFSHVNLPHPSITNLSSKLISIPFAKLKTPNKSFVVISFNLLNRINRLDALETFSNAQLSIVWPYTEFISLAKIYLSLIMSMSCFTCIPTLLIKSPCIGYSLFTRHISADDGYQWACSELTLMFSNNIRWTSNGNNQ